MYLRKLYRFMHKFNYYVNDSKLQENSARHSIAQGLCKVVLGGGVKGFLELKK
jgi:hypothetical protein